MPGYLHIGRSQSFISPLFDAGAWKTARYTYGVTTSTTNRPWRSVATGVNRQDVGAPLLSVSKDKTRPRR